MLWTIAHGCSLVCKVQGLFLVPSLLCVDLLVTPFSSMSTVGGRLSRREQMRVERLRCGGREFRGGVCVWRTDRKFVS